MTLRLITLLAVLASSLGSSVAAAQDCDRGRELFERAVRVLEEGRAALGRDLLLESSRECPRFATYMNLAIALRRTGESPRAVELLRALLAGEHGELDAARRGDVEAQLELAVEELAIVRLRVTGPEQTTVEVDGAAVAESARETPVDIPVAAGSHIVNVAAEGWSAQRERVVVASGDVHELHLTLTPTPSLQDEPSDDESSFPTLWVVGGLALASVIAVVAIVLVTSSGGEEEPRVIGSFETLLFP